ncbi:ATP-binding cassette domain-containing protein [Nocardia sp. NPDC051756]|uniref:ATP-binding cassette domain-containing protein n=1 Tax=Nocardia sp. NPDC051756 TaxID=3154751 RepID=UPI0034392DCA
MADLSFVGRGGLRCALSEAGCPEVVVAWDAVGYVPQEGVTAFEPGTTVGAQLRTVAQHHGARSIERACAAAHYPAYALDLLPQQNSGGQIQRAALAAALLPAPPILIADGPTNSLDQETAYAVWKSLRAMHEGRIRAAGSTAQLSESADGYVRTLLESSSKI